MEARTEWTTSIDGLVDVVDREGVVEGRSFATSATLARLVGPLRKIGELLQAVL